MNKTGIGYLDFTWNPTTGCTFGCPECWARGVAQTRLYPAMLKSSLSLSGSLEHSSSRESRSAKAEAYRTFAPTLHPERLGEPAARKKPAVIGVCFMGDLFDPELIHGKTTHIISAADEASQHTYIFLTKQPKFMAWIFGIESSFGPQEPRPNWYLGFSARNQAEFDAGWPHMAKLAAAGWKVWVSLEPMQDWIDVDVCPTCEAMTIEECGKGPCPLGGPAINVLSGVILGAQSGKNPAPFKTDWARSIRDQCAAAGVPFMYKQGPHQKTGKLVTLPELDGEIHDALAWR
jgi:protein gp37